MSSKRKGNRPGPKPNRGRFRLLELPPEEEQRLAEYRDSIAALPKGPRKVVFKPPPLPPPPPPEPDIRPETVLMDTQLPPPLGNDPFDLFGDFQWEPMVNSLQDSDIWWDKF